MLKVDRAILVLVSEGSGDDERSIAIRGNDIWGASQTRIFKGSVLDGSTPLDAPIFLDHEEVKSVMPFPGVYDMHHEDGSIVFSMDLPSGSWRGRAIHAPGNRVWLHYDAVISAIRTSKGLKSLTVRAGDLLKAAALMAQGTDDPDAPVTLYLPNETLPLLLVRRAGQNDERVAALSRMEKAKTQEPRLWKFIGDAPRLEDLEKE
jgi:hypothetical protein